MTAEPAFGAFEAAYAADAIEAVEVVGGLVAGRSEAS